MHILMTALLGCAMPATLPADPAQRTAVRALRGDFGVLTPWQTTGYELIRKRGTTCDQTVLLTWYGPPERDARVDCKGRPCTARTAASNTISQDSFVFVVSSGLTRLKQIRDRGAWSNERVAKRRGNSHWLDYWAKQSFGTRNRVPVAVVTP